MTDDRKGDALRKRVGRILSLARTGRGLRQDDLVARTEGFKLTKSLISRYENGFVLPSIERLRAMLEACDAGPVPSEIDAAYRHLALGANHLTQTIATEVTKEFIKTWVESPTVQEVAESLGMSRKQVLWFATRLRAKGIKLPKKPRTSTSAEDWAEVVRFAKELGIEPGEQP